MQGMQAGNVGLILGREDLLEEGMATRSSILAWRITTDRETSGLSPQRAGHIATENTLSLSTQVAGQLDSTEGPLGLRGRCLSGSWRPC